MRINPISITNRKSKQPEYIVGDVIPYAATIAFSHARLLGKTQNNQLTNEALETLQKFQRTDGSWSWWGEDEQSSIEATAMALHAILMTQPKGWYHAAKAASNWLWSMQSTSGYWYEEGSPNPVHLSVLVLDAIELANGGAKLTFSPNMYRGGKSIKAKDRTPNYRFNVALSFPGEAREKVEEIAKGLVRRIGKDKVFYDKFFEAELARPNLDVYLQTIYHNESKLIVLFLCEDYEKKEWCGLEWRAIRDLIKKREDESIMPLRLDNADISGLFSIDGYIDISNRNSKEIINLICSRIEQH